MQRTHNKVSDKERSDYLFTGLTTRTNSSPITSAHHRLLIKEWCSSLGIGVEGRSTHSLRKTRASIAYKQTGNLEVVRQALGHTNLRNTATYLDIDTEELLEVMRKVRAKMLSKSKKRSEAIAPNRKME